MKSIGERGSRGRWLAAALVVPVLLLGGVRAGAQTEGGDRTPLFERVAGSWSGSGVANISGSTSERIRCRADYQPAGPSQLRLVLRCASDSFNLQVESSIARVGDRITGTWTETSVGVSGDVSGTVGADHLRATVSGLGVSAQLSVALRGGVQAVTIQSQGQIAASASITLRRA